jgi:hypothetical protein
MFLVGRSDPAGPSSRDEGPAGPIRGDMREADIYYKVAF